METAGRQFNAAVGRQMKGEISAAGSSIAAMARELGIARSALDNYTTGKRAIPLTTFHDVCVALGMEPHEMLARAEERYRAEERARGSQQAAPVTPLRRRPDVPDHRHNEAEVAFDSGVSHRDDTDDLYDD
ncbi:helix-turn-helix domain-containing protein [Microbacterium sp. XT11]|uniref:helix-turn-helix domain-containing protein n=1 Tax=Microbacterium sp. XT11 TaxID=367477 RepID=UPI000742F2D5|nr:helix-turn-helix transcriptional regulator [Microbacterium sp. XT11]ALX67373.1 hypothetical protein AB663_003292 [Microbacterium sp. XT11]